MVLITIVLQHTIRSGIVIPPVLFFRLYGFFVFWFYMYFRIVYSSSMKNVVDMLLGIALNM